MAHMRHVAYAPCPHVGDEPEVPVELTVLTGLHTLLSKYLPLVFSLGYRVRRCAWEGRVDGAVKGIVAKGVIEHCLVTQVHLLQDWDCKAEYTKSLACALLSWRLEYSRMPACLFVEEACEAMLSRLASRVRHHPHLSSYRQTLDLFLSLPRPSLQVRGTRGGIRVGLVGLMVRRLQGIIDNASSLKFARLISARRSVWDGAYATEFRFPTWIPERFDVDRLRGVFQCAMVHMAGLARSDSRVEDFLESEVPLRGSYAIRRQEMALDTIAEWRRQRNIRLRRPVAREPRAVVLESPLDAESALYEPPGDEVSQGYVSSGCTDSVGSIMDLVEHPVDLPPGGDDLVDSDFDL